MNKFFSLIFAICSVIFAFFTVFDLKIAKNAKSYEENIEIEAKGFCLIEKTTNRVIYKKDEHVRLPMASTTKIITAILAIENTEDLDEIKTVPDSAVGTEGSSMYLKYGEKYSVRELLYGLMLPSGNDSANAIAEIVFGSIENYRVKANEFVKSLGLTDTNIVTPSGLHDDNHYTSAYDLAIISSYAMNNETFREIVKTPSMHYPKTESNTEKRLRNKNKIMYEYNLINGIKTGYTPEAGRCLVASANNGELEFICVLLNSPKMENLGKIMLEKAFSEYKIAEIIPSYKHIASVPVLSSETKDIGLFSKNSFSYPVKKSEESKINILYDYPTNFVAPVESNTKVGTVKVYFENDLIFEDDIFTINGAENTDYSFALKKVLQNF